MSNSRMFVVVFDSGMSCSDPEYVVATFKHLDDAICYVNNWNARLGAMGAHFVCADSTKGIKCSQNATRLANDFIKEEFGVTAYVNPETGCQFRIDSVEGVKLFC